MTTINRVGPYTANYIVYKGDDGRTYVKNGKTGHIEFSSTDDAEAIQYAIDNTYNSGGGKVFIHNSIYYISKSLILRSGVEIEGVFPVRKLVEPITPDSNIAEIVRGTILIATDSNLTCFTGNNLIGVYLHNLAIKGFNRAIDVGTTNMLGMAFSRIENLYIDNLGDVAIRIINLQHLRISHIKSIIPEGSMFMYLANDHSGWSGGNSVIDDVFVTGGRGTDGVIFIDAINNSFNLVEIIRPQVNMGGSNNTGSGIRLRGAGGNAGVSRINLYGVDVEGGPNAAVKLEGPTYQNFILLSFTDATYGVIDSAYNNVYPTNNIVFSPFRNRHKLTNPNNYILLTAPAYTPIEGNSVIIDVGWKSGESDRLRIWYFGKMVLSVRYDGKVFMYDRNSGVATIPANSTSVTVSHGLSTKPTKVLITPLGQPPGKLWVQNITSTSFDIATDTAPTTDLQVAWRAEV